MGEDIRRRQARFDALYAAPARVRDLDVARWDLDQVARNLRDAVASMPLAAVPSDDDLVVPPGDVLPFDRARAPRRRAPWLWAVAGVAAAVLVVVAVAITRTGGDSRTEQPPAGDASTTTTRVAPPPVPASVPTPEDLTAIDSLPRLVPTTPGWSVRRVEVPFPGEGIIALGDGDDELAVNWKPADTYQHLVESQAETGATPGPALTIAGQPAATFSGGPERATSPDVTAGPGPSLSALFVLGDLAVEVYGTVDAATWETVLGGLVELPADRWAGELPDDVVLPSRYAATFEATVSDIPLPPGFDLEGVRSRAQATITSTANIARSVTLLVTCRWLDSWSTARAAGDTATAQAAVDAMATSHTWDALVRTEGQNSAAQSVWAVADAMPTDAVPALASTPVSQSYREVLGCP